MSELLLNSASGFEPEGDSAKPSARTAPASLRSKQLRSVLLLGLGNDILSDDAVGLRVVQTVREALKPTDGIDAVETEEMGLALLDFLAGYQELVIVDAVQTGRAPAGHLHEFDGDALKLLPRISPHFLGVGEILSLGRTLGLDMPERVRIFAIEVADPFTLGTRLTPAVQEALPAIVERVLLFLQRRRDAGSSRQEWH